MVIDGDVLDKKFVTMAEMLQAHGYKTIGLCPNPYISKFSGLHRGFEVFCDPAHGSLGPRLYDLFNRAALHRGWEGMKGDTNRFLERRHFFDAELGRAHGLEILRKLSVSKRALWEFTGLFDKYAKTTNKVAYKLIDKAEEPFFVFIHYNETHTPYVLPRGFRERFMTPIPEKKPWEINQDYFKYYSGEAKMGELDFSVLRAIYDGAIGYLDAKVFDIYSFLEKKGLLDNTMVIITSDHGDSFGEHGILFHHFSLYDTLIRTPLIIKYPVSLGLSGIENRMVQNTDLLPTIMDMLKVDDKKLLDQIQGNSLVSSSISNRDHSYAISELVKPFGPRMLSLGGKLKKYNRQLISIRTENNKYIYASNGNHEFYDLQKDPNETKNLIDSQDPGIEELQQKLKSWLTVFHDCCRKIRQKIDHEKAETQFETEVQQRLRSLGYL